jgi:leucyl aminopeptidase
MGALLGVSQGSARDAQLLVLKWNGKGAGDPDLALVGKGVTFDTGGISLKPGPGMEDMKWDMGGAGAVVGAMKALALRKAKANVVGVCGLVENMPDGNAQRPGDIVTSMSGQTIEVINTDAEGRLVLCDLIAEACEEDPALLLDCATLTGAARVALGPDLPALFCNEDGWAEAILRAGTACADPLWRMPLWRGYASWLNSPVADLNNVSSKAFAGAIVAGLFLQRFVRQGIAWAHVDLYGWNDTTVPGRPEGGEGQAIRALFGAIKGHFAA